MEAEWERMQYIGKIVVFWSRKGHRDYFVQWPYFSQKINVSGGKRCLILGQREV